MWKAALLLWLAVFAVATTASDYSTASQINVSGQGIYMDRLGISCTNRPLLKFHYVNEGNGNSHMDYSCYDTVTINTTVTTTTAYVANGGSYGTLVALAPLIADCGNQPMVGIRVVNGASNTWAYEVVCGTATNVTGLTSYLTDWATGGTPVTNLAYQTVACTATNTALVRFQLQISGSNARYNYTCGSLPQSASSRLDPHFIGFNGQYYDVDGIPDKWLNWYSDENIQVNSLIYTAVPETKATYSAAFAIQLGPRIRIYWAVHPDRLLRFFPFRREGGKYMLDSCGYAEQQGRDRVVIVWNEYTITLVQRQKLVAGHRFRFLNFFMNAARFTPKVHGLMGQTHRLPAGLAGKGKQGQGIIEGTIYDYVVNDGHWGSNFTFNAFRKAPGTLSPELCVSLMPTIGFSASSD